MKTFKGFKSATFFIFKSQALIEEINDVPVPQCSMTLLIQRMHPSAEVKSALVEMDLELEEFVDLMWFLSAAKTQGKVFELAAKEIEASPQGLNFKLSADTLQVDL